ncbi:FAD-linked oxidase C-terminal domain-containing protein [Fulvimonas sp. R45]|uniref:FAD-binding oxidoreductase n=1 Tax=Fulvimonas sp. R45 TaxID=3045937 RepID=UPI00265E431E|nr:FAD-linked oxidase C-terminal domain-containing protein [Fulvimonas sp. R45]MDO1529516.1 FAD-linked oxidase C-terminal domain-containing protein [Fulvimonas sp. R45]
MTLPSALLHTLRTIFPDDALATAEDARRAAARDNSRYEQLPEAVVFPTAHAQVEALVRACREHRVPLTARGGGTSSTGASVPVQSGVVANFMRMDRILRIDPDDRLVVVQPGVTNEALQQALAPHGFFWAPDPGSAPWCTVGGNLACNASGPHAVKYGSTRDNVLGLAAVAGTGESFRCGTQTTKSAIGYDLTRLLVGSEGTLAVITEATLKLTPKPAALRTLRASYRDAASAARAVARIMAQPATPCALEFMDALALKLARDHQPEAGVPQVGALLMIELDGAADALDAATAAVEAAARVDGLLHWEVARDEMQTRALWAARKALSLAQRAVTQHKINEDVVVPVSRLPELVDCVRALSEKHAVPIVSFGHAGNGNLHVNLLPRDLDEIERAYAALPGLFARVIELGGTLSGEHGIGVVKREFMPLALSGETLGLMRGIKAAFDPDGILNPGKLLP